MMQYDGGGGNRRECRWRNDAADGENKITEKCGELSKTTSGEISKK